LFLEIATSFLTWPFSPHPPPHFKFFLGPLRHRPPPYSLGDWRSGDRVVPFTPRGFSRARVPGIILKLLSVFSPPPPLVSNDFLGYHLTFFRHPPPSFSFLPAFYVFPFFCTSFLMSEKIFLSPIVCIMPPEDSFILGLSPLLHYGPVVVAPGPFLISVPI